jgi:hypothetical protein
LISNSAIATIYVGRALGFVNAIRTQAFVESCPPLFTEGARAFTLEDERAGGIARRALWSLHRSSRDTRIVFRGDRVEAFFVLVLLPIAIGVGAEVVFRDVVRSSIVAALTAPALVYFSITTLDPEGTWNWLASLLVAPLAMAFALAAVMVCFGRAQARKRPPRRSA